MVDGNVDEVVKTVADAILEAFPGAVQEDPSNPLGESGKPVTSLASLDWRNSQFRELTPRNIPYDELKERRTIREVVVRLSKKPDLVVRVNKKITEKRRFFSNPEPPGHLILKKQGYVV